MVQVHLEVLRLVCKVKLIQVYNSLKDTGDLNGCLIDFQSHLNNTFNKSITYTGTTVSNFLADVDISSWSYQDLSELYVILNLL